MAEFWFRSSDVQDFQLAGDALVIDAEAYLGSGPQVLAGIISLNYC